MADSRRITRLLPKTVIRDRRKQSTPPSAEGKVTSGAACQICARHVPSCRSRNFHRSSASEAALGERRFYKPVARKPLAICVRIVRAHKPEFLVMLKGFAISVICIGTLMAVDYELNDGIYTDQVLGMLRQIHYSFGR